MLQDSVFPCPTCVRLSCMFCVRCILRCGHLCRLEGVFGCRGRNLQCVFDRVRQHPGMLTVNGQGHLASARTWHSQPCAEWWPQLVHGHNGANGMEFRIGPDDGNMLPGPWGDNPSTCSRSSSTVSFSTRAHSSSPTRTTQTKTKACKTGTDSISQQEGFPRVDPAGVQLVRSRRTTFPGSTLTREKLGWSRARLVHLVD